MESDLPLMELAEEDDFLIQPFPDPNQTPSKSSFNYFTCSPLALPPSRTKSLNDSVHIEKPSSSSTESSNNKENINSNNVELPKLAMGPIQMKRKKKGGDYNLRKSLAWDRAFFTDEGILDPRELNLITGINAYTCGRGLPSISEEGSSNSSFSSSSKCRNQPNDIKASKEALLRELYDKNHTPKGNKVGNHDSLPHHKTHSSSKANSSTKSQLAHVEKANKDESTPLTAKNLAQLTPTTNNNSLPSGLRLPSPSLRFFDQTTTSESISLHQKRIQQNGDIRPPLTPRTPLSNSLSPSSNYMTKGVSNSNVYQDIVRKMQYECRGIDVESDKVIEKEKIVLGHEGKMGIEKIALKGSEEIKESEFELHNEEEKSTAGESSQHQEQNVLSILDGSMDFLQDLSQTSEVELKTDLENQNGKKMGIIIGNLLERSDVYEHDKKQSNPIVLEQSISHGDVFDFNGDGQPNEHQDFVGVMSSMEMYDFKKNKDATVLIKKSNKQAEFHLASEDPVNEVFVESQRGKIGKREICLPIEDDARCDNTYSSQKQEGVDVGLIFEQPLAELQLEYKGDNAILETESSSYPQSLEEQGIIIGSLLKSGNMMGIEGSKINYGDEVEEGKNKDATMLMKKSNIKSQDKSLVKYPQNAVTISDEWLPVIEASRKDELDGLMQDLTEKFDASKVNLECHLDAGSLEVEDRVNEVIVGSQRGKIGKRQDDVGGLSVNCITPAESSSPEEINNHLFKEKSSSTCSSVMLMEVQCQNQQPSTSVKATSTTLSSLIPEDKDAIVLMRKSNNIVRQAKSLVKHMPSGVPISDECLAAIEAPGEDLAQTSRAQTDTEISNSPNFTPESHLDSLEAEDRVNDVFVESQRGKIGKIEDSESLLTAEVEEGKNKDTTVLIKKSNTIKRQEDKSLVIHPPNAVPFSDEWLAAIEAAGEEILTMKRGAVQHSPPDKSIPERNPWSPVKNKTNQIGPYDCTKYMNAMSSNHDSSDQ
ncbi:hypothetical protein L1887_06721 [Cichorium endivia]|nr:hypothetical protein L1887_06721 [Cichorium endivia]